MSQVFGHQHRCAKGVCHRGVCREHLDSRQHWACWKMEDAFVKPLQLQHASSLAFSRRLLQRLSLSGISGHIFVASYLEVAVQGSFSLAEDLHLHRPHGRGIGGGGAAGGSHPTRAALLCR